MSTLRKLIHLSEEIILTVFLGILILLACLQISLRLFFDSGLLWADPLLRYLVLWGGMLGAVYAVAQDRHISLDVIDAVIGKKGRRYIKPVTWVFCGIVCGFLSHASYTFIRDEMEFGGTTLFSIPSWAWNLIFPIAFGIMTLRYIVGAVLLVIELRKPKQSHRSGPNE